MLVERIERYIVDHYVSFETEETQKNTRVIDRLIHHIFNVSVILEYPLDEKIKQACKGFTARAIHLQLLAEVARSAHYVALITLLSLVILNIPWIVTGVKVLLASLTLFHFIPASNCWSLLQNTPPNLFSNEGMILLGMIGFAVAIRNSFKNRVNFEHISLRRVIQNFLKEYGKTYPGYDLGMTFGVDFERSEILKTINRILETPKKFFFSIYSLEGSKKMFPVNALTSPSEASDLGELNSLPQEVLVEIFKCTITLGMENYRHLTLTSKKIRKILHQSKPFWEGICRFFAIESDPAPLEDSLGELQAAVVTQFSRWNKICTLRWIHMQSITSMGKDVFRALPTIKIFLGTSCFWNIIIEGMPLIWFSKKIGEEIDRQSPQEITAPYKGKLYYSSGIYACFSLSRDSNTEQISIDINPFQDDANKMRISKDAAGQWWISFNNGQTKAPLI